MNYINNDDFNFNEVTSKTFVEKKLVERSLTEN